MIGLLLASVLYVGICERHISDPANDSAFLAVRNECAKIAELEALRVMLLSRDFEIKKKREDVLATERCKEGLEVTSQNWLELMAASEKQLKNFSVRSTDESWDAETGIYRLRVSAGYGAVKDSYEKWIRSSSHATELGSRMFLDGKGERVFVGIGMHSSRSQARMLARQNLADTVLMRLSVQDKLSSGWSRILDMENSKFDSWSSFVGSIVQDTSTEVPGRLVYEADGVVEPISGQAMWLCVYARGNEDQEIRSRAQFIGVAKSTIDDPKKNSDFMQVRRKLAKIALLNAKKEMIIDLFGKTEGYSHLNRIMEEKNDSLETSKRFTWMIKQFAEKRLGRCVAIWSRESWNEKKREYEIRIAVKSEKDRHGRNHLHTIEFSAPDEEWEAWCKEQNLALILGSRQFTDKEGNARILGVGVAEIEGLKGTEYKLAKMAAREDAQEHLEFALFSDNAVRAIAERYSKELEDETVKNSVTWDQFASEVISQCRIQALPSKGMEVYSMETLDPITGKEIYISVCGTIVK